MEKVEPVCTESIAETVYLCCAKCNVKMRHTGKVLASLPPWFEYQCPKCGESEYSRKKYPYLR